MSESGWQFDAGEVLLAKDSGRWWHVSHRWQDVDNDQRQYELADATHTEYKILIADDVEGFGSIEGMFESAGWTTNTKPAAERGYRVNGVLCGPRKIQKWKGQECVHEYQCPTCGADGYGELDVIHDHAEDRVCCECRMCNEMWEVDSDE
jgi:hypothetical protein